MYWLKHIHVASQLHFISFYCYLHYYILNVLKHVFFTLAAYSLFLLLLF